METKEQLVKVIKDWIRIDNEIKLLQNELNIRKAEKKKTSSTKYKFTIENKI
jgi:hypothetical protein